MNEQPKDEKPKKPETRGWKSPFLWTEWGDYSGIKLSKRKTLVTGGVSILYENLKVLDSVDPAVFKDFSVPLP